MDPLSILASSAALFEALKQAMRFAKDVIKAPEERREFNQRLQCVETVGTVLDARLEEEKDQPEQLWFKILDPKQNENSPLIALYETMIKMVDILKEKEKKWKQKLNDFKWHSEKKSLEECFVAINGYCSTIGLILNSAQIGISREQIAIAKDHMAISQAMAANLEQQREEEKKRRDNDERKAIEKWLSPLDFQAKATEYFDESAETGQWFLDLPEFQAWKRGELKNLRGYGDFGVGKTFLSSIVISYLKQEQTYPVICLFLEYKPLVPHTEKALLGSLLKQLIQLSNSEILPDLLETYRRATRLNAQPTQPEVWRLLQAQLDIYNRIFLVVDALDETTSQSRSFVEDKISEISDKLSLLTTRRVDEERSENDRFCDSCKKTVNFYYHCFNCDEAGEKSDLCFDCKSKGVACWINPSHELSIPESIDVTIYTPEKDLKVYVETAIRRQMPKGLSGNQRNGRRVDVDMIPQTRNSTPLGRKCQKDEDLLNRIVSVVSKNSSRKFLFAKLYIDNLSSQLTLGEINKALKEIAEPLKIFPDVITKLYDKTMNDRICQQDENLKGLALKTLALVTFAYRPLKLIELRHALAVRAGATDYAPENDVDDAEILNATKGLILIDRDKNQYVRLFHLTLLGYFEKTKGSWFPNGEVEMANTCLTYLSFDAFLEPCSDPKDFQAKEEKYPFVTYAVQYWGDHVRLAGDTVKPAAVKYLQDLKRVNAYVQAAWATETHERDKWDVRRDIHALHICAWFDLVSLVSELMDSQGPDVTDQTYGQTPLMYACRRGHFLTARRLLGFGASVNKKSDRGRTPIIEAVLKKRKETVILLLDAKRYDEKLEINAANPRLDDRTALMIATADGSTEICEAVLRHPNTLINLQDALGFTALSIAASFGYVEVVGFILAMPGVDVNLTEHEGGRSALILAAEGNHSRIIELLLQNGADPELKDSTGGTAILRAIEKGCAEAFGELIKHQVDLNCMDEQGRSLMHAAAEHGEHDIIRVLKNKTLDVNVPDKNGMTPMHYACKEGEFEAAELMLRFDADSAIKDSFDRTPFTVAWQYGQPELMDLCRDSGTNREADWTQCIKLEDLPIWSLVTLRRLDLIEAAIALHKADLSIREPGTNNTVLHSAIIDNRIDEVREINRAYILRALLAVGSISPNETNKFKRTPLHFAAVFNSVEATEVLLEYGPKLDEVDRFDLTPLMIALTDENYDIAIVLVAAGAKLDEKKVDLNKMLLEAVERQNVKAVEKLILAGADRMAQDEYGRTADMLARQSDDGELLSILQSAKSFLYPGKKMDEIKAPKDIPFRPFHSRVIELD